MLNTYWRVRLEKATYSLRKDNAKVLKGPCLFN